MSGIRSTFTGKAGHLAVMSELLLRGWNVAIPEVDIGDDIYVVHDREGDVRRVQVKTTIITSRRGNYTAQFAISQRQIDTPRVPSLWLILAVRDPRSWRDFLIIKSDDLRQQQVLKRIGQPRLNTLNLRIRREGNLALCQQADLTPWLNNWRQWPIVNHQNLGPP